MTEAQGYTAWLVKLLAEYGSDPEKCEAIRHWDTQEGRGLLELLLGWYARDHPDRVTTTTERGTLESADNRDVVCRVGARRGEAGVSEGAAE